MRWSAIAVCVLVGCGGHGDTTGDDGPIDAEIQVPDARDLSGDDDDDGISDLDEGRYDPDPPDSDDDGTPDWQDTDSDEDCTSDLDEGITDFDGDGLPDYIDPINDGDPLPITLTAISTTFNSPIGIDYHEPSDSVVISTNYPTGNPSVLELIEADGDHMAFSAYAGLTDEVKIATVRSGNVGGFVTGDLFVGNGIEGQIIRVTDGGATVINPWVDLLGADNGLMRGSLFVDRLGLYGGDLFVVTTGGELWRITSAGVPQFMADVDVHLEGLQIVPNCAAKFGPIAGKILAGAEGVGLLYAFNEDGTYTTYNLGILPEDIDFVLPRENFFGVNFGTSRLLGAGVDELRSLLGDMLVTVETVAGGTSGLYRLKWDGTNLIAQPIPLTAESAVPGQWEHVTLAPAGIVEVPPVD